MSSTYAVDVAILGAGTAGLYALREVKRAGRSFVMIDPGPLGTTCARVGCMPSKIALHAGAQWATQWAAQQRAANSGGSEGVVLQPDRARTWADLREVRDRFTASAVNKATSGAGEHLLIGSARFLEPTVIEVDAAQGKCIVRARSVVIAVGSRPVRPDWLADLGDRVITTDELFELRELPESIGIFGLGAIGLEMGLALARLGVKVVAADVADAVAGIRDPEVAACANARFGRELDLWLGASAEAVGDGDGVMLRCGQRRARVDKVLAAMGRRPNVDRLALAAAGFALDQRGMPSFDQETLQIGTAPVFIAGDADGLRPLLHEAADEGAVAGYNAARVPAPAARFRRKTAVAIAFSDPDVASIGASLDALDTARIHIGTARGEGNGRARILDAADSVLRIYADAESGVLLGASLMAAGGEHIAHLLAWAIQRGETARSLLQLPFYHPVVEEMVQSALQDLVRQDSHKDKDKDKDEWPSGLIPCKA